MKYSELFTIKEIIIPLPESIVNKLCDIKHKSNFGIYKLKLKDKSIRNNIIIDQFKGNIVGKLIDKSTKKEYLDIYNGLDKEFPNYSGDDIIKIKRTDGIIRCLGISKWIKRA